MRRNVKMLGVVLLMCAVVGVLYLVGINALLGCESWDREQWNYMHSCTLGPFDD